MSARRSGDFSVRSSTRKLPFRLLVQYSVKFQESDRLWAFTGTLARELPRIATQIDELGLRWFRGQTELPHREVDNGTFPSTSVGCFGGNWHDLHRSEMMATAPESTAES
jgi:hypothetical protein